jgi:glycosyltransferase involved in cell wall biosynthesis
LIRVLTFGRFADSNFGGLERYVFELAKSLKGEAQYTNIVASRSGSPDIEVVGETIRARPWLSLGGTPVCPSMVHHALRVHKSGPLDIVHLQFPADPMAHFAVMSLPPTVKRVITWHSDIVRQRILLKLYRPFLHRLLRAADAIIAATPAHFHSSTQLEIVRSRDIFHVVPYGIDVDRFADPPALASVLRKRYGSSFLIFALGRHVYYKGFEFLVRALRRVPAATLVLGGQGPLTANLRRMAQENGIANRVAFVGRIPDVDLPAYYHACDVFCMPSVEPAEAFGMVQVEAMAAGRPVVCCELHNGVTYVNRDGVTGLVVPSADADALATALQRLAEDPALRARLGKQARERARREFNLEAMARGTLGVYRRVLGCRPDEGAAR